MSQTRLLNHSGLRRSEALDRLNAQLDQPRLSRTRFADVPVSRSVFRSQSTIAKPCVDRFAIAVASCTVPAKPLCCTDTTLGNHQAVTSSTRVCPTSGSRDVVGDELDDFPVSCAPGTMNSHSTLAPATIRSLARATITSSAARLDERAEHIATGGGSRATLCDGGRLRTHDPYLVSRARQWCSERARRERHPPR